MPEKKQEERFMIISKRELSLIEMKRRMGGRKKVKGAYVEQI